MTFATTAEVTFLSDALRPKADYYAHRVAIASAGTAGGAGNRILRLARPRHEGGDA